MSLSEAMPPPLLAATLILLRPSARTPFETLMIRRGEGMVFAAGALAFPGGRIDPEDHVRGGEEEAAARIAAIRETMEEVGILVGIDGAHPAALADRDFAGLLASGARLDLDALTPFSRWLPGEWVVRRFDTRFYLAAVPADAEAVADGRECAEAFWATPADVLAGGHHMLPPTRMNLERLATLDSIDAAIAHARAFPAGEPIVTRLEHRDGRDWVCIPDDRGYPRTSAPITSRPV
jgi:8-oxo-dGTP pyrophosphatase MutT (NUDIX family)